MAVTLSRRLAPGGKAWEQRRDKALTNYASVRGAPVCHGNGGGRRLRNCGEVTGGVRRVGDGARREDLEVAGGGVLDCSEASTLVLYEAGSRYMENADTWKMQTPPAHHTGREGVVLAIELPVPGVALWAQQTT